jgi:hypothetical protein
MTATYELTYAGLLADLVAFTEDNSNEFLANVDTIIGLAEARIKRDLDLEIFQSEISVGSTVSGTRTISRPASLLATSSLWITSSSAKVMLESRSYDFCLTYAPTVATTGTPLYYAEIDTSNFYLVPTPNATITVTALGTIRPAGLSSTNTTSWFGTNCGDLLLAACLVESERFLKNNDQVDKWKVDYIEKLEAAKREFSGIRRLSHPAPMAEK